jgi:hypothetical protein
MQWPERRTLVSTAPTFIQGVDGMKSNEIKAAVHSDARRAVMRLTLAGVLAVGLSACGGGGGGDDSSDDSKDLRAALKRLEAGMTYDEVVAAVGWEPNVNRNTWSHNGYQLQIGMWTPNDAPRGSEQVIEDAHLTGAGYAERRIFY